MSKPLLPDEITSAVRALPPDAQDAVRQFIAFLQGQHAAGSAPQKTPRVSRKTRRVPLRDDPAIGQWKGRADMADSAEYVRALRRKHWGGAE